LTVKFLTLIIYFKHNGDEPPQDAYLYSATDCFTAVANEQLKRACEVREGDRQ